MSLSEGNGSVANWSIIVAVDEAGGIGKDNALLCPISEDLKRFKLLTTGHAIVMGRKTFESLPKGALPNRRNIVLTNNKELKYPDCEMMHSVTEVMENTKQESEVFIIGGAAIYSIFYSKVSKIYLTQIHKRLDADTFFPEINWNDWEVLAQSDPSTHATYSFINLIRKSLN